MKSKKSGEKQLKPAKSQNKIISWVLISVTKAFGHHVLLLPATVLRTPTNPLTYGLHTKTETHKGSLKLWIEIWNASQDTVLGLFLLIAWVMQCQTISKPRKYLASVPNKNKQKQAQQLDALLLSTGLLWDHRPRLKTKVVPSKVKGKNCKLLQYFHGQKLRSRTSATLSLILNGAVSASLISPSYFGLFGNAGATSNINSRWKHPI